MANKDARGGLMPYMWGAEDALRLTVCYVPSTDATALYPGDPVIFAGSSDSRGIPTVTRASLGDGNPIAGVVHGVLPVHHNLAPSTTPLEVSYRAASTAAYVTVDFSEDALYAIQGDSAHALVAGDVGANANLMSAHAGNTAYGRSGLELDASGIATTSTFQLNIVGLVDEPKNSWATNADVVVRINNHSFSRGEAGV